MAEFSDIEREAVGQWYSAYLAILYARYNLDGRRAVLAELLPLLNESERDLLRPLMRAAGFSWQGFTD